MIMNLLLFILAVIYLLMSYRAKHIYKCKYMRWSNSIEYILGSIVSAATEGVAWWWFFNYIKNYL